MVCIPCAALIQSSPVTMYWFHSGRYVPGLQDEVSEEAWVAWCLRLASTWAGGALLCREGAQSPPSSWVGCACCRTLAAGLPLSVSLFKVNELLKSLDELG